MAQTYDMWGINWVRHSEYEADLAAERARADELRRACADVLGCDPETWPAHGNAPLAIAASLALAVAHRDRLREALRQILGWRELRSGANEWPVERIEEIARAALKESEQ